MPYKTRAILSFIFYLLSTASIATGIVLLMLKRDEIVAIIVLFFFGALFFFAGLLAMPKTKSNGEPFEVEQKPHTPKRRRMKTKKNKYVYISKSLEDEEEEEEDEIIAMEMVDDD